MSSLISGFKDILKNRVLPLLPGIVLATIFDRFMLPKAASDLEIVMNELREQVLKGKMLSVGIEKPALKELQVIGLVGLPQTGKSTVAGVLSSQTGAFHLDSNSIRGWLIDARRDYANINAIVLACMQYLLMQEKVSVIMDSDCVLPSKRAFIEAVAKRAGAKSVMYVAVAVTYDVWKARLSQLGYFIHRMYIDGVRRSLLALGTSVDIVPIVPIEAVKKCVIEERDRQESPHLKYVESIELVTVLGNNTSQLALQQKASRIADLFLS